MLDLSTYYDRYRGLCQVLLSAVLFAAVRWCFSICAPVRVMFRWVWLGGGRCGYLYRSNPISSYARILSVSCFVGLVLFGD